MPSKWWEKIKLSKNYQEALTQIEERLQYFPKFLLHKCKQRLTRLVQVATRMRKIAAEEARLGEQLVPKMAPKIKHREEARERKALAAAKLERSIERELLERLRQGAYGDQPLNCNTAIWKKVLNALENEGEGSRDKDMDAGIEDEDDEDELEKELEQEEEDAESELDGQVEYISDFDESDEDLADIEDWLGSEEDDHADDDDDDEDSDEDDDETTKKKAKTGDKRKRGKVVRMKGKKRREIEVESERETNELLAF
jgi:protein MAK16